MTRKKGPLFPISHLNQGTEVAARTLAGMMIRLKEAGCCDINLVTPSHVVPQILEALFLAARTGLDLPLVYNSGGYDSREDPFHHAGESVLHLAGRPLGSRLAP